MTMRNRGRLNFQIRNPELLESRDLLAGHGLEGAFSHFAAAAQFAGFHGDTTSANALATVQAAAHSHVFAALGSLASTSEKTVLTAQLTDPNNSEAAGTVKFKTYTSDGVSETAFKVSITGAAASTTLDVAIGDTVVGQITTDANGAGTLELSSNPDDADEQALPDNFPTSVAADTVVTVGTLSGTLATPTHSGHGCSEANRTALSTPLVDATGTATGTASYVSNAKHDATTTKFSVSITGATADSTLDVAIGGTVVGQLTTDANGAGSVVWSSNPTGTQLALPTNFPTSITAGTTVTVGSLSGTFATDTSATSSFARFSRHR